MKRLMLCVVVLAIVAGMSFAIEIGGSTAVSGVGNDAEQLLRIEQVINVSVADFSVSLDCLTYDWLFADKESAWDYEVNASYGLEAFTFGAIFVGEKDTALDTIQPYIDFAIGPVGADVDVLLSMVKEKDVFQGAEFSAFWNPGPLELRIGYMLTNEATVDANTPEALDGGGFYGTATISY